MLSTGTMLFEFPLMERMQSKFVRLDKIHMGEAGVLNP